MNPLAQFENKRKIIIFTILGFIIIIIILSIIFKNINSTPRIKIDNLNSVQNLSSEVKDSIETGLYNIVKDNTVGQIPSSGALVRDNTISSEYNTTTRVYSGNFIVDIDKIKQSYFVQFEWSKDKNNTNLSSTPILLTCIRDKSLVIYQDFQCKDQLINNIDNKDESANYLSGYLPHIEKLSDGENFVVLDNGKNYLLVQLDSCKNKALVSEAIEKTKSWISSLELNPDNFIIDTIKDCNAGPAF